MGAFNFLCGLLILGITIQVSSAYFYERYIDQYLNPQDSFDTRTWRNRYFVDEDSYVEDGPIFVHIGAWDVYLSEARMNVSHFLEIGQDMNALLVFTEHRFYGESRPTADTSMNSFQYLDTRYALADVANLLVQLKSQYGNAPVILHGYDHGGAMAVWMRQRYPDLVDGVWASSASLEARMDFGEYFTNIGLSLRQIGGDQCYQQVEDAFTTMGTHYDNQNFEYLQQHFDLCSPIVPNDKMHEVEFFAFYSLALSEILRYSHVYGFKLLCDYVTQYEYPMEGFANFFKIIYPTCVPLNSYYESLDMSRNTTWESDGAQLGTRQTAYVTCREFGRFKASSDYYEQPFGNRFPIEFFQDQCADVFGPVFSAANIYQFTQNTNQIFGGLSPNVTKVYFTDGDLDPAKTVGVTEAFGEEIYVDIIPNFAAGAEILPAGSLQDDVISDVQARARELISRWISEASRN